METSSPGTPLSLSGASELFARAFQASPLAILITRLADSTILEVNSMFESISGYSAGEVIGRTPMALDLWANPGDRDHWRAELEEKGSVHDVPLQFRRKDGRIVSTRLSSSVISLGSEPGIITMVQDVTAQEIAERNIRESEKKYSTVFDTCPEAIAVSRASDGVQLEINQAWTQQTGYSREQGLGRSALELGLWPDLAHRKQVLAQLDAEGRISNFATKFMHADGSARDVLVSGTRLTLNGEACIAWAWRDISDLRRLEKERVESEQRYRTLFDSALDAIVTLSASGTILEINKFGLHTTGYTSDELVGRSMEVLFDPVKFARNPLRTADVHRLGVVRMNRTIRRKDGGDLPAEIVAGPLPDGNIMAIVRDMSERKRSQALLQNIARGVTSVVGETFFRSLVGSLSKELSADYCFIGEVLPDDPTRVRTLAFCANGKESPNFEYALEGSPCSLALSRRGSVAFPARVCDQFPADLGLKKLGVQGYVGTSLVDAMGNGIGILVVMSRELITEVGLWTSVLEIFGARAAAEIQRAHADARLRELNFSLEQRVRDRTAELELANHELESFSYSISHDLRAPLRAINGFAKVLSVDYREKLDKDASSLLLRIEQNATRMNGLIEDVLEFARVGRGTLNPRRVDMRALVDEVIAEMQASAGTGAQVSVGDLPHATGDAVVVRQIWQNLIGNALKFSRHATPPRIAIEGAGNGRMVEYTIRDNGAGFDAAYADKLFGVFQRLHTGSEFEGTGIGLAIVRRIVQRHGGSISAEGAVGGGATFRFTLPAAPQPK
ncbi:MAG: PAS domain S-box protein [Proteobacteria bacterium]|nr:PAS domain S-box protein [Pseudomonadota bacterium]